MKVTAPAPSSLPPKVPEVLANQVQFQNWAKREIQTLSRHNVTF